MRSPALLIGICLLGLVTVQAAAESVPVPTPAPKPKVGPPPSATGGKPQAQLGPGQSSGNSFFPFKLPFGGDDKAAAFDAKQRALIDRVNVYLMSVTTLVGDFVQVGPDGRRAEGKIYLQKPGRVRFEYNPPSPIELVADGSSLVVRDRKLDTQDLYPLSQTPLRFILADKIDLLRDTTVTGIYSDDVFSTVVIEEKHAIAGKHRLMLMFGANDLTLRQWTVTDPQGFDTTVAVYNLDMNKKPDPGLFKINYERVLQ